MTNEIIKKPKKPWPTKAVMKQVYEQKLWGDNATAFYSGDGSHQLEIVKPYVAAVSSFLTSFEKPIIVCDLGCGDFNVGKELVKYTSKYIAVDIVPDLIAFNKEKFRATNLEFKCMDLAVNHLPHGDCAILRQVLQHLSNAEVKSIINKLNAYQYVIVTEHLPAGDFIANKDIISGQGIRIKKNSGLNLLEAPFYFKVKSAKQLVSVKLADNKEIIVTMLYQLF